MAPDSGVAATRPAWPGVVRPAGWFLSAPGEAAPPGAGTEPARTDADPGQAVRPESRAAQSGPVAGPTPSLRGWPRGPGLVVPAEAVPGGYAPAHRSGWQLSHGVWQDSGIDWAHGTVDPDPAPGWGEYQPGARFEAPSPAARSRLAESADPGELYRAWQGSVRQAARPRAAARHQVAAWRIVRVGVPAAIIVTVGVGAVMMLTGTTSQMLADRAIQGIPEGRTGGAAMARASGTFPGYPGQRGAVTVSSIMSAGGARLAVGSAGGRPAVWHRAADGTWTLVSASLPAVYRWPGTANLTSVAYGPAGWIAVGHAGSGTARRPVVVTSADGVTWHALDHTAAFAGPDTYVMGVAASGRGYVIVGKRVAGRRVFAAMWWSADLRNWVAGHNGGLDGRLRSSTAYAVGATPAGFVAAGSHGTCHAIWISPDGRHWRVQDVPVRAGASTAGLRLVAVNGTSAIAAGSVITKAGDVPVVVVSADGGQHWHQIVLTTPGGLGAVTALTAAGSGFVAAGQVGPAGAGQAVTWRSPDGFSWSAATPVGGGVRRITALTAAGTSAGTGAGAVTGIAQRGAASSLVTIPAVG